MTPEEFLSHQAQANRQAFYDRLLNPVPSNPIAIPQQFDANSGLQRVRVGNQIKLAKTETNGTLKDTPVRLRQGQGFASVDYIQHKPKDKPLLPPAREQETYAAPYIYTRLYESPDPSPRRELWLAGHIDEPLLLDTVAFISTEQIPDPDSVTYTKQNFSGVGTSVSDITKAEVNGLTFEFEGTSTSTAPGTAFSPEESERVDVVINLPQPYTVTSMIVSLDVTTTPTGGTADSYFYGDVLLVGIAAVSIFDGMTVSTATTQTYSDQTGPTELYALSAGTNTLAAIVGSGIRSISGGPSTVAVQMTGAITMQRQILTIVDTFDDAIYTPDPPDRFFTTGGGGSATTNIFSGGIESSGTGEGDITYNLWVHFSASDPFQFSSISAGIRIVTQPDPGSPLPPGTGSITRSGGIVAGFQDHTGRLPNPLDLIYQASGVRSDEPEYAVNFEALTPEAVEAAGLQQLFAAGDYTFFVSAQSESSVGYTLSSAGFQIVLTTQAGEVIQPESIRFGMSAWRDAGKTKTAITHLRWTKQDGTDPTDERLLKYIQVEDNTIVSTQSDQKPQGSFGDIPDITANSDDWRAATHLSFQNDGSIPVDPDSCREAYKLNKEVNIQSRVGQVTLLTCDLQQEVAPGVTLEERLETDDATGRLIQVAPLTSGMECTTGTAKNKKVTIKGSEVDMTIEAIAPLRIK